MTTESAKDFALSRISGCSGPRPYDTQLPRRKPRAWRGVESGVNTASKSVTNAAAARLRQRSRPRASLPKTRLHKANQQGKSGSSLELGFLTFGTHLSSPSCPRKRASRAVDLAVAALGPRLRGGDEEGRGTDRSGYFMAPVMKIANPAESGRRAVP
jgi:hypothetical protein